MNQNLSVQTQFKLYQINKMEKKINFPAIRSDIKDKQKFIDSNVELMQSLNVNGSDPILNSANLKIRNAISEQVKKVEDSIESLVKKDGADTEFYKSAISATVESLLNNGIYPQTRFICLSVLKNDLVKNLDAFNLSYGSIKENFEMIARKVANEQNIDIEAFSFSQLGDLPGEYATNFSFPGCSKMNDFAFAVLKEFDDTFSGLVSATNSLGDDLMQVSRDNETYTRALRSLDKKVVDGLYSERFSDLTDKYESIVTNNEKFSKAYDKWEKTSFENESQFDFGELK